MVMISQKLPKIIKNYLSVNNLGQLADNCSRR